ncbi:MAG: hypothetical protein C4315_09950 [Chloroflexota bacterium]
MKLGGLAAAGLSRPPELAGRLGRKCQHLNANGEHRPGPGLPELFRLRPLYGGCRPGSGRLYFTDFTPAVDWLLHHRFGLPPEVAQGATAAVRFLVLWPHLVGLRRFRQDLMVRFVRPKSIAWAVLAPLRVVGAVVFLGPTLFRLPGAAFGTLAWALGVAAEALLIAWWSRPAVHWALKEDPPWGALL